MKYTDYLEEKYFEQLHSIPTNGSEYCIVQGELVEELHPDYGDGSDHRIGAGDAMDVARLLNRGDVDSAEELVNDILEE